MAQINTELEFVGSGKIKAGVDTIHLRDTYITDSLRVSEAGQAELDGRFVTNSVLGALNELLDGLTTTSGLVAVDGTAELFFTPASGTEFVIQHDLDSDIWAWGMWSTDTNPIEFIQPENIYPSGVNHVAVTLDQPANGRIIISIGGPHGGDSAHVDAREATGNIIPNVSGVYGLGSPSKPWLVSYADFGVLSRNATITSNRNENLMDLNNTHGSYIANMQLLRCDRPASNVWNFLVGQSDVATSANTRILFRGDGAIFSDIAAATPADYAEYMECSDASGIAAGYAVTLDSNGLIEIASSGTIGFVSAAPAYVADSAWSNWHKKYLRDDFGAKILDENGEESINPDWNSGLVYVPREDRAEWVAVGLLGKVWVRAHDETLVKGDYVKIGASGIVTKANAEDTPRWPVLQSGIAFDVAKGYGTTRILYT